MKASDSSVGTGRHIGALDAVRGTAIGFVMLCHARPTLFSSAGFVGVEVFFVLSGFLITSILLKDVERSRVSFGRFFYNRAVRLMPALTVAVVGTTSIALILDLDDGRANAAGGVFTALTYTSDISGLPWQPFSFLTHLWTVSVEEQFYLLWPFAMVMSLRAGVARRRLGVAALVAGSVIAGVTICLAAAADDLPAMYTWPMIWSWTLLVGSSVGLGLDRWPRTPLAAVIALVALAALSVAPEPADDPVRWVFVLCASCVLSVVVIGNAVSDRPVWLLQLRPLQFLGTISYAAYLWNWPISRWTPTYAQIPLTIAVATISWYVVEKRFLKLKRAPQPDRQQRPDGLVDLV